MMLICRLTGDRLVTEKIFRPGNIATGTPSHKRTSRSRRYDWQELTWMLIASEQTTRLLPNSTGDAIYCIDLHGECIFANRSCLWWSVMASGRQQFWLRVGLAPQYEVSWVCWFVGCAKRLRGAPSLRRWFLWCIIYLVPSGRDTHAPYREVKFGTWKRDAEHHERNAPSSLWPFLCCPVQSKNFLSG